MTLITRLFKKSILSKFLIEEIYLCALQKEKNSTKGAILEKCYPGYGWAMMTLKITWYSRTSLSMLWVSYECYDSICNHCLFLKSSY